ncbi:MAG: hypothetical protein JWM44_1768 [Bacilli bacterium]|jgi:hypothetical protein|nr:hypothetical protein [Bacilli bacterium]
MIVFDVVVNGEVKETIQPVIQRLKAMYDYMKEQMKIMKKKYGEDIQLNRRIIY